MEGTVMEGTVMDGTVMDGTVMDGTVSGERAKAHLPPKIRLKRTNRQTHRRDCGSA